MEVLSRAYSATAIEANARTALSGAVNDDLRNFHNECSTNRGQDGFWDFDRRLLEAPLRKTKCLPAEILGAVPPVHPDIDRGKMSPDFH